MVVVVVGSLLVDFVVLVRMEVVIRMEVLRVEVLVPVHLRWIKKKEGNEHALIHILQPATGYAKCHR